MAPPAVAQCRGLCTPKPCAVKKEKKEKQQQPKKPLEIKMSAFEF